MADNPTVKEITDKIEAGVKDLYESEKYADYLRTMSRFHRYSARNIMLIHLQKPDATHVAGYQSWKNKFKRQVKRGEHGIKILAPAPFIIKEEKEILDPLTKKPIINEYGEPLHEEIEIKTARFKVASVFDISQTVGEPLPQLAETLTGDVERYELFMDALKAISPLPVVFEYLPPDTDGTCTFGDKIRIREGMSEIQTVSATIHEIAHAKLHDIEALRFVDADVKPKDRRTEEIEAESVSFTICQYYGIETGANTFGYLAAWSKGKEQKELQSSLETIRKASTELIDKIDDKYKELAKERGIDLTVEVKMTEEEIIANQNEIDNEKIIDLPSILRSKLYEMFPDFMNRDYSYVRLESEGNEPIALKWLNSRLLSIMYVNDNFEDESLNTQIIFEAEFYETDRSEVMEINAIECIENDPYIYRARDDGGRWVCYDENDKETYEYEFQNTINQQALEWFNEIGEKKYKKIESIDNEPSELITKESFLAQPDLLVSEQEMNEYGYINQSMLPLYKDRALELFDSGDNVYLLFRNNSESLVFDRSEIEFYDGMFGIERNDWKFILDFNNMKTLLEKSESTRQAMLIYGKENQFGIYQVINEGDIAREYMFENMNRLDFRGLSVDRANYELVYTAPLTIHDPMVCLNILYSKFQGENPMRPADFNARSVSVSDVIVFQQNGDVSSYFVDSYGFKEIPNFINHDRLPVINIPDPTVDELKAEVDEGKSISLMDLSKAVHAEQKQTVSKGKPSLLDTLERNKQKTTQAKQAAIVTKTNTTEVTK